MLQETLPEKERPGQETLTSGINPSTSETDTAKSAEEPASEAKIITTESGSSAALRALKAAESARTLAKELTAQTQKRPAENVNDAPAPKTIKVLMEENEVSSTTMDELLEAANKSKEINSGSDEDFCFYGSRTATSYNSVSISEIVYSFGIPLCDQIPTMYELLTDLLEKYVVRIL